MNFFKRMMSQFSVRGRALKKVEQGMDCARKRETESALEHYNDVIQSRVTPKDVFVMALYNRSLVLTAVGKNDAATTDLRTLLDMSEAPANIKQLAREKLVRMEKRSQAVEDS